MTEALHPEECHGHRGKSILIIPMMKGILSDLPTKLIVVGATWLHKMCSLGDLSGEEDSCTTKDGASLEPKCFCRSILALYML